MYLPPVLFGFAPLIPRARASALSPAARPKNDHSAVRFDRGNNFANPLSYVPERAFLITKNVMTLAGRE